MATRKVLVTCEWLCSSTPTAEDWANAATVEMTYYVYTDAYEEVATEYIEESDDEPGDGFDDPISVWIKDGDRVAHVVVTREATIAYHGKVQDDQ